MPLFDVALYAASDSHIRNGAWPEGAGVGQAPSQVVETERLEVEQKAYASTPSIFDYAHQGSDGNTSASCSTPDAGNAFTYLSGTALSSAFSKALTKSVLPTAGKARILTEVTGITNIEAKERARREWLATRLTST